MKNVTISMDEATLAWVRVEAAKAGLSVSRWIADRLSRDQARGAEASIEAFLAEPGWDLDLGNDPFDREAIYDERIRGLERGHLRTGPEDAGQTEDRAGLAEAARPLGAAGDERPGRK